MPAIDLTDAVQVAMVATLKAGITLAPVYAVVPDGVKPPYVVIPSSTVDDFGVKGGRAERHQVLVRYFSIGTSKRDLLAMMAEGKAALNGRILSFDGALLSRPVMLSANEIRDFDVSALVGEQEWLVIAQPAN